MIKKTFKIFKEKCINKTTGPGLSFTLDDRNTYCNRNICTKNPDLSDTKDCKELYKNGTFTPMKI